MINKKLLVTVSVLVIFGLVLLFIYTQKVKNDSADSTKRASLVSGKAMLNVENCVATVESEKYISSVYQGATISIRAGNKNDYDKNIITTTDTDADGNFVVYLNPGEYCAVFSDKSEKPVRGDGNDEVIKFDKDGKYYLAKLNVACDDNWRSNCDAVLNVPKGGLSDVVITRDAPCVDECVN